MADQSRVCGVRTALVEKGFKAAGGTLQKKCADSGGHIIFYTKTGKPTTETRKRGQLFFRSPEPAYFAGEGSLSSK